MGRVGGEEDEVERAEEEVDGGGELGLLVKDPGAGGGDGEGGGGSDGGSGRLLETRVEGERGDEPVEVGDEVVEVDVEGFSCGRQRSLKREKRGSAFRRAREEEEREGRRRTNPVPRAARKR